MGTGGPPPEIDVISEFQGGQRTFRLRLELSLSLSESDHDDLLEHLDGDERAEAVDLVLNLQSWDSASEKLIRVALNPSAYTLTQA